MSLFPRSVSILSQLHKLQIEVVYVFLFVSSLFASPFGVESYGLNSNIGLPIRQEKTLYKNSF